MKLQNIKKGWVTTIIGSLFLISDLAIFVLPIFENSFKTDSVLLLAGAFIGVGLLLSPDDVLQKLKEKI